MKNILLFYVLFFYCTVQLLAQAKKSTASDPIANRVILSMDQMREKAINYYVGNPEVNNSETKRIIDDLQQKGDATAKAWKGLFLYFGTGGYLLNEDEGLSLMEESVDSLNVKNIFGDAEATYLLWMRTLMKMETNKDIKQSSTLFNKVDSSGYLPYLLTAGTIYYYLKEYNNAILILNKAYANGAKHAATLMGKIYQNELFPDKNFQHAMDWYQIAAQSGDEEAMLNIAKIYYDGDNTQPNIPECLKWIKKAAGKGYTSALCFIGEIYLKDNEGKPKNISLALNSYKWAAEKGNREAMFALGALYYDGKIIGFKDNSLALYWTKKAAEEGQARAMFFLSQLYTEGEVTSKNVIKARYWRNQAEIKGVGWGNEKATSDNPLLTAMKYGDFSNTYTVYDDGYGGLQVIDNGPDLMGGMISGLFGGWVQSRANQQEIINGVEFIQEKRKSKIYGGTITSSFETPIALKKGQKLKFETSGTVVLGMFAGQSSPNGLYVSGFEHYSLKSSINHGAVMGKIGNGNWFIIGTNKTIAIEADGDLFIAINDKDYSNNKGYYDIKIELYD